MFSCLFTLGSLDVGAATDAHETRVWVRCTGEDVSGPDRIVSSVTSRLSTCSSISRVLSLSSTLYESLEETSVVDATVPSSDPSIVVSDDKDDSDSIVTTGGAIQPTISSGHAQPATWSTIAFWRSVKAGVKIAHRTIRISRVE